MFDLGLELCILLSIKGFVALVDNLLISCAYLLIIFSCFVGLLKRVLTRSLINLAKWLV